jgi:hypothetical protein
MTLDRLVAHVYPGGRTLSRRQVQRQARILERIGFLVWDAGAVVSRTRPREYLGIELAALVTIDRALLAPAARPKRDTKGDTNHDTNHDISPGVDLEPELDPDDVPRSDRPRPADDGTGIYDRIKSNTAPRVVAREVYRAPPPPAGWGLSNTDPDAFEAEIAARPLPGLFATAPMARKLGYAIFDANRRAGHAPPPFADEWRQLEAALRRQGIHTCEDHCRRAMSHVYVQRSPADRASARQADHARRRTYQ